MTSNVTATLADFAAGLKFEDIPEHVRENCRILLLDTLACALAGHLGDETPQIAAMAGALGHSEESSIIGGGRTTLAGATLLNGFLITAVTMCDVHRSTLTHITPEVVPPALAIAERDGLSGRELMVALVAGSETATRIGLGLDFPEFRKRGWHGPGVFGLFGSAAAVGRLRKFNGETMARAFGLAGSQSAGTFAAWGTPTVKFHQCRGALSGLMASLLAEQKFVATKEFFTAPDGGLLNTYTNGGRPQDMVAGLGQRWEMEQIALRLWPSASTIQGMITATFDLVERHQLKPADVRRIRVAMSKTAVDLHGIFPRYKAKFEALLSTHYAAAVILHDGELSLAQFEPSRYDDPVLRRFSAEQVEVVADASLSGVQAVVEAETTDGRKLSVRCEHPLGSPERPLTRAQVENKFRTYAKARLPAARIDAVLNAVAKLEDVASVAELMTLLRAA